MALLEQPLGACIVGECAWGPRPVVKPHVGVYAAQGRGFDQGAQQLVVLHNVHLAVLCRQVMGQQANHGVVERRVHVQDLRRQYTASWQQSDAGCGGRQQIHIVRRRLQPGRCVLVLVLVIMHVQLAQHCQGACTINCLKCHDCLTAPAHLLQYATQHMQRPYN